MRELLTTVPLFAGVSSEILAQLSEAMRSRRLASGQPLFFKGDPGDQLFVIREGEVKLVLTGGEAQDAILDVLREGDYFGEMALFDEQPRSTDAVATRPTVLLALHRDDFRALIRRYPDLAFPILRARCQRLRRTTDRLEESLFLDLPARLARVLLRLAQDHGQATPTEIRIQRSVTQQELAELAGATRPRVNEQLQRLRRQKIVSLERREIEILRPDALQRLAYS